MPPEPDDAGLRTWHAAGTAVALGDFGLARGAFQKHFLRFAGAAVILLGLINIRYGLVLTGNDMNVATVETTKAAGIVIGGVHTAEPQRISMKVVGLDYQPHQFTVKQGVPVQWWIDASQAEGCGRVLVSPRLRIQKILSGSSTTLISFMIGPHGVVRQQC